MNRTLLFILVALVALFVVACDPGAGLIDAGPADAGTDAPAPVDAGTGG